MFSLLSYDLYAARVSDDALPSAPTGWAAEPSPYRWLQLEPGVNTTPAEQVTSLPTVRDPTNIITGEYWRA